MGVTSTNPKVAITVKDCTSSASQESLVVDQLISLTLQDGLSPVYVASQTGQADVVAVLIKAGADINQAMTMVCWKMWWRVWKLDWCDNLD